MTEIILYQLHENSNYNTGFARVIESVSKKGKILQIIANNIEECDLYLWTYSPLSFLTHATKNDPYPSKQKVYITDIITDNANNADIIAFFGGIQITDVIVKQILSFEKALFIFGMNDTILLEQSEHNLATNSVSYRKFIQQKNGAWVTS